MVWKTVPCSRSSVREAALSELGSAPRLGVDSCAGGSETRSTAGTRSTSAVWLVRCLKNLNPARCYQIRRCLKQWLKWGVPDPLRTALPKDETHLLQVQTPLLRTLLLNWSVSNPWGRDRVGQLICNVIRSYPGRTGPTDRAYSWLGEVRRLWNGSLPNALAVHFNHWSEGSSVRVSNGSDTKDASRDSTIFTRAKLC